LSIANLNCIVVEVVQCLQEVVSLQKKGSHVVSLYFKGCQEC
jgi:hypothetical protein